MWRVLARLSTMMKTMRLEQRWTPRSSHPSNAVIERLGAVIVPPVDTDARERFVDGLVRWYADGDVDSALVEVSGWIHELNGNQHEG